MIRDPNWLYSTTAQSTAALVAIIGGFLVSRVISTATSREVLERHLREVQADIARVTPRFEQVEAELLEDDLEDFLSESQDWIIGAAVHGSLDDLTTQLLVDAGVDDQGRNAADFDTGLTGVIARVRDAQAAVTAISDDELPRSINAARRMGFEIGEDDEWIWDGLLQWREQNKPVNQLAGLLGALRSDSLTIPSPVMPFVPSVVQSNWRRDRERDRADLADRLEGLVTRRDEAAGDLDRLRVTSQLTEPVWILVGFAAVGLIYPLALLSLNPVPGAAWARVSVLLAFIAGLGALVRYFVKEIRRLDGTEATGGNR